MSKIVRTCALLLGGALTGCGDGAPSTADPGPPPPHGGTLVALPEGKGFVEVVTKGGAPEAAFYFLKGDNSPYTPAPTSGTLTTAAQKKVALRPEGGGLVTPAGVPAFGKGGVDGILSVELDGKAETIPLGLR